jgi:hypothetical protein
MEVTELRDGDTVERMWQLVNRYRNFFQTQLASFPEAVIADCAKGGSRGCGDSDRE